MSIELITERHGAKIEVVLWHNLRDKNRPRTGFKRTPNLRTGIKFIATCPGYFTSCFAGALMKGKLTTILIVCNCLALTSAQKAQAQAGQRVQRVEPPLNRCTILADYGPVWLRIYEEVGDGSLGWIVYDGKLDHGGKHMIISGTERVRYCYKTAENDEMHGNIGAWCYRGNTIRVP